MRNFLLILLLLLQPFYLCASEIENEFAQYRAGTGAKKVFYANKIMGELYKNGVSDSLYRFSHNESEPDMTATVTYWMGEYYYAQSDYARCVKIATEALSLCRKSGNQIQLSDCLGLLGIAYHRRGSSERP